MTDQKLNIGLFGFGVVGESLYHVLQNNTSLRASIRKVCIKHPEKKRNAPAALFTTDPCDILQDDSINVIVELIDDAEAAFTIVATALGHKKAVVSANKKMIAEHLTELLDLQSVFRAPFLYEAACCASIPVIRNLEEYYDNDLLHGISGIVNGSTNYILTKISEERIPFAQALKQAQDAGFAESNPALDIEGTDAVNKLTILLLHAYGIITVPRDFLHSGIHLLHDKDARFAEEKGYVIKLVAYAKKLPGGGIAAFVLPHFIAKSSRLYHVYDEYNGIIIDSGLADQQFFCGKGAGGNPTASAVLSDLSALRYGYRYEYKKLYSQQQNKLTTDFLLRVYISFSNIWQLPEDFMEYIEEWTSNEKRCLVTGVVKFTKMVENKWWKGKNVSLILMPDAFVSELHNEVKEMHLEPVLD